MDILPLIPEINALLPSEQTGSRSQRPPFSFTVGQTLQATVSSREGTGAFTLNMGGQELAIKSSTSLQIGQTFSVKITAVSPQLQLQVVEPPPADQRISTALQSLVNQGKAFSQISALADSVSHSSQLSVRSQDVLQQMSGKLSGISAQNSQLGTMIEQIASTLLRSVPASGAESASNGFTTVGQLLQQLAGFSDLSPKLRENITALADSFLRATGSFKIAHPESAASHTLLSSAMTGESKQGTELLQQMSQLNPSLQALLQPIAEQLGQQLWHSENHLVEQLLRIFIQAGTELGTAQQPTFDGRQLRQTLHGMGLNLEQLLAQGDTQQAAGTLKFALLELSNLSSANQSQLQTIDELLGSIQSSQLMQTRLSYESIFFLPLPFPCLQSGFLLIENEKQREGSKQTTKKQDGHDKEVGIYLQLEGLGNLRITVHQKDDQISLTFYSQDKERAQFLGAHREELQELLTTGTLSSARFLTGAKDPIKTLIEKIIHAPTGMVNTVA